MSLPGETAEELPPAVVVVGGAGMVGRWVVRRWAAALAAEHQEAAPCVVSLDLRACPEADVSVQADLCEPEAVQRLLFGHFRVQAMIVAVKPPLVGPSYQGFVELNLAGVCDLARLAEKHGVGQLVYVSSIAACDHWTPHTGVGESDPSLSPHFSTLRSPYDLSKAMAEDFILQRHQPDGMRTVSVRIGGVYGEDRDPYWHRRLPFGMSADTSPTPDCPTVDSNYVENVAEAMLRVQKTLRGNASVGGRFYMYTHGDRFCNQQVLSQMIAKRAGRVHLSVPWWLMRPLLAKVKFLEALPLMLPSRMWSQPCGRAVTPKSYFTANSMSACGFINQTYDNSLFRSTFGYSHVYTMEETVELIAQRVEAEAARRSEEPSSAVTAAGLPMVLCFCATLVVGFCGGFDPRPNAAPKAFSRECNLEVLGIPDVHRLAHACIMLSAPITHLLAFATQPAYRLWQPFEGGKLHVLLQGVGWTCFSLACLQWILALLHLVPQLATNAGIVWQAIHHALDADDHVRAASGVASQILLGLSLFVFRGRMIEKSA